MAAQDSWVFRRDGVEFSPCEDAYLANGYIGFRVGPYGFGTKDRPCLGLMSGLRYGRFSGAVGSSATTHQPMVHLPDVTRFDMLIDGKNPLLNADICQEFDTFSAILKNRINCEFFDISTKLLVNGKFKNIIQQEITIYPRKSCQLNLDISINDFPSKGLIRSSQDSSSFIYEIEDVDNEKLHVDAFCEIQGKPIDLSNPFILKLNKGTEIVIRKIAMISQLYEDYSYDFEDMENQHLEYWAMQWDSRIEVEDANWQKLLNMAQYSLKASHRDDNYHSIAPMGLSSDAWNGYVFPWDACLWILPYYQLTAPQQARNMLDFELNGTIFSQPRLEYYASGEGIKMYEPGCIAFAAWQHYILTDDIDWLAEKGIRIIKAACEGYHKRAILGSETELYEIHHIWPTDEFASKDSNNNVFTNAIAGLTFDIYKSACEKLGGDFPEKYIDIQRRKFILPFDIANNRHLEYDGYDGHEIKQADTNLLTWPLGLISDKTIMRNNLEYYSRKISETGTPEMTWGVYTTIAGQLDDVNLMNDLLAEFGAFFRGDYFTSYETRDNDNAIFLTGCSDLLNAVYYGAAGFLPDSKGLPEFKSPGKTTLGNITLHGLTWRDKRYCVKIRGKDVKIQQP